MQILFIILAALGSAYFLYRKAVDPIAAAFGASILYFAPAFFGHIKFSKGYTEGGKYLGEYASTIHPAAYGCMIIVLMAVVSAAAIFDRIPVRHIRRLPGDRFTPSILALIIVVASIMSIRTVSTYYLCADKSITLTQIDSWYYWAAYALPLCLVSAVVLRQWVIAALCVLLLGADIFVGFRVNAAVCLVSLLILIGWMLFHGKRSALMFIGIVAIGGMSLFVVKTLAYNIKSIYAVTCIFDDAPHEIVIVGRSDSRAAVKQFARAFTLGSTYTDSILNSEPFVIQAILNETIAQQFRTPADYLGKQVLSAIPGGATIFGLSLGDVPLFSDLFKHKLFGDIPFGMASNPWAQAYAAGGYMLIAIFAAIYAGSVGALGYVFKASKGSLRALTLVISVWIAFYFHRNDVMTELGILKQTVYIAIAAVVLSTAISGGTTVFQKLASRRHRA
jgi:hypothetical protein